MIVTAIVKVFFALTRSVAICFCNLRESGW